MKKFLTLAALAAFIAAPAMAEDNKTPAEKEAHVNEWIKDADTDGNGTVSKAEFTADAGKKFDEADKNSDGQLSKDEKMEWKEEKKG